MTTLTIYQPTALWAYGGGMWLDTFYYDTKILLIFQIWKKTRTAKMFIWSFYPSPYTHTHTYI